MRLTIHRGTHEIGGSCVELCSASGKTRVVIDLGLPLVNADRSPFEWSEHRHKSETVLTADGILPSIPGLYHDDTPPVHAVLLSHAHLDHCGLLRFVHPSVPVYMSEGSRGLAEVSDLFLDAGVTVDSVRTFEMWRTFEVGEFQITPYLMDHSAPDAVAFLVEADKQRLFYSGDFRGHGRKGVLLDRLAANPPPRVDYLVMEGSMIGREGGLYADEASVEEALRNLISQHGGPCYVFASSQNLDRLVSIYHAARRSQKTLVIDLYTAFVLDKLSTISPRIPRFDWNGVRVLFAHYHAQRLAEQDVRLLYKYRNAKIEFEDIRAAPDGNVLLAKDSRYFRNVINKLKDAAKGIAVYSMWHGCLERSNLAELLASWGIPLAEVHTSGHAYVRDLQRLAAALEPRYVIPIHTFYPEKFREVFANVVMLEDGRTMDLC